MRTLRHIFQIAILGAALLWQAPAEALTFSPHSLMQNGKWVKIAVPANGIYTVTHEQLRQLGFQNPEQVNVWGQGGIMYGINFINSSTGVREIPDDMDQISTWYHDNKLYFYGKGPENIDWQKENAFKIPGRFANKGLNIYSADGIYFLSDVGSRRAVTTGEAATSEAALEHGYAYFYHEKDETQGTSHSGQNFWGESFLAPDQHSRDFEYRAPGLRPGTPAVLNVRFNALAWLGSSLTMKVDENVVGTGYFDARPENGYYFELENNRQTFDVDNMQKLGKVGLTWNAPNCDLTDARLDYILLSYNRNLTFDEGENQFQATVCATDTAAVRLPEGNDVVCWDVTDPSSVQMLQSHNGVASLTAGNRNLVFFKTDAVMSAPKIIGEVSNIDLRGRLVAANPELIIITTEEFRNRAEQLAEFHRINDKKAIEVVTIDEVYNDFSAGRADPMAYRSMLRMVYEQSGSKLKGVLLYGPQLSNVRGTNMEQPREAIIVYQNPVSDHVSSCIAFTDIYGIFSDSMAKYFAVEQMHISVAALPVLSDAEAERYYNKVLNYYYDQGRPYYMERMIVTADDYDRGSHQSQAEELALTLNQLNDSTTVMEKIYFGEYGNPGVKQPMYNAFTEGASYAYYIGHGSPLQIGKAGAFINPSDIGNFTNNRLGFMTFASCETTLYEVGNRGVSEHMLLSTEGGLIGMMGTVRTAFSGDNFGIMKMMKQMIVNLPKSNNGIPTEFGELVRRTKNGITGYEGKYKFHLMGDPLLKLMLPSMNLSMTSKPTTAKVGEKTHFEGRVMTPTGAAVNDFNGTVVLKWYKPEWSARRQFKVSNNPGETAYTYYDHEVMSTQAFEVKNGRFDINEELPEVMRQYAGQRVRVTLTAYDPTQQVGATWSGKAVIDSQSAEAPITDTEKPEVTTMRAEGSVENHMLPSDFTLLIEAGDNSGIRIDEKAYDTPLVLTIDGKMEPVGIAGHAIMSDGARKMVIRYPLRKLSAGRHTAVISLTDFAGNVATGEYTFEVGSAADTEAPLLAESACRHQATFSMAETTAAHVNEAMLVITDAYGNEMYSSPWSGDTQVWSLKNMKGERVSPGLYKAFIRFIDNDGRGAVTKGTYVPVLGME